MGSSVGSALTSLLLSLALIGCAPGAPNAASRPTARVKRPVAPIAQSPPPPESALPADAGSIAPAAVGNLVGKVKAPATLLSDKGLGLVSDQGGSLVSDKGLGFRVLALTQAPAAGVEVALVNADGSAVTGADGRPITATTDAEGRYALDYRGNTSHMIVRARLADEKGDLVALLPRDAGAEKRTVDLDLTSTLVMRYVLQQYVKGDPAVLDKLPVDVERRTQEAMAAAVEATGFETPEDLAPERVVGAVEALRKRDTGIDGQMEAVRKLLVAGVSDQGNGMPADRFETDAADVAVGADGTIYFAGVITQRVWKKDAQGKLAVFAGSGMPPNDSLPAPGQPAVGDGGAATEAIILPQSIALLPDGRMLILEKAQKRVRIVGTDGIITTYAAHAEWGEPRDLAVEADGSVLVATHSAIYRVAPDTTISLVAGAHVPFDPRTAAGAAGSGDGGPALEARFGQIFAMAVDQRSGAIYVYDFTGQIRRIADGRIEPFAGVAYPSGTLGLGEFAGDGGPATSAKISRLGGLAVRADGAVLISDSVNRRIRLVKDGVINTVAGTGVSGLPADGAASQQPLLEPRLMTLTPGGALFFTDMGYVRKLVDGQLTTLVGGLRHLGQKRPANEIQLLEAADLHYDASTNAMLIGDGRHLFRWTLDDDQIEAIASKGPAGVPFTEGASALENDLIMFRSPIIEPDGGITVCATSNSTYTTRMITLRNGVFTTLAGGTLGQKPSADLPVLDATVAGPDLALVRLGDTYYYSVRVFGRIRSFTAGGTTADFAGYGQATADGTAPLDFDFKVVTALAKGPDGNLYVGDEGKIFRIDMASSQVTHIAGAGYGFASGDGGSALSAKLGYPEGFAFDTAGHLYFSDALNNRVRRVDKDTGLITSVAGSGTSNYGGNTADTGLAFPRGLAFDAAGNLYIADYFHGQIKVVPANRL